MADYKCPFKVGDSVMVVKPDSDEIYDTTKGPGWVEEMDDYIGQHDIIREVEERGDHYRIRFADKDFYDDYIWKDDWLIAVNYTLF